MRPPTLSSFEALPHSDFEKNVLVICQFSNHYCWGGERLVAISVICRNNYLANCAAAWTGATIVGPATPQTAPLPKAAALGPPRATRSIYDPYDIFYGSLNFTQYAHSTTLRTLRTLRTLCTLCTLRTLCTSLPVCTLQNYVAAKRESHASDKFTSIKQITSKWNPHQRRERTCTTIQKIEQVW